jgi:vancomycin resistance protein YoaR
VEARDGRLAPRVEQAWLTRRLRAVLRSTGAAPRDATVRLVRGKPQVVPGRRGLHLATERAAARFLTMLATERGRRTSPLPTHVGKPRVSTSTAAQWGIERVVSSFTTYYPHAEYRNINIGRAAELVDGTVLAPGEMFSLNRVVGERTAQNGFARGFIISDGIFKEDYGGGVSQVATTVFNAAFFAGLKDVEHKPHSFYIDRYPVGREATVAWPAVDLRFRNDTEYGVLVQTIHAPNIPASSGALTVRMWSTKVWVITARTGQRYSFTEPQVRVLTGDDCVPNTGYEGFQVVVTRVFRRPGRERVDHVERMHTTYTPSDTVVCQ